MPKIFRARILVYRFRSLSIFFLALCIISFYLHCKHMAICLKLLQCANAFQCVRCTTQCLCEWNRIWSPHDHISTVLSQCNGQTHYYIAQTKVAIKYTSSFNRWMSESATFGDVVIVAENKWGDRVAAEATYYIYINSFTKSCIQNVQCTKCILAPVERLRNSIFFFVDF